MDRFRRLARHTPDPLPHLPADPWERRPSGLFIPKGYHPAGGTRGPWGFDQLGLDPTEIELPTIDQE